MSLARTLCLLLIAGLGSCSGLLPNSAVSRHMANRYQGAVNSATPVAKVIHDRGIRVPDESAEQPLLEQLQDQLAKSDDTGAFAGITYDLTRGNSLPRATWRSRARSGRLGRTTWVCNRRYLPGSARRT